MNNAYYPIYFLTFLWVLLHSIGVYFYYFEMYLSMRSVLLGVSYQWLIWYIFTRPPG